MITRIPCTKGVGRQEAPDSIKVTIGANDRGVVLELENDRWIYLGTDEAWELAMAINDVWQNLPSLRCNRCGRPTIVCKRKCPE